MLDFDACPHCGQKVLKGAMKCAGCGKTLKTSEEQIASIRNRRESKKRRDIQRILETLIIVSSLGFLIYHFFDQISAFFYSILQK
jgi:uncharacterized membrane protein YvbJ